MGWSAVYPAYWLKWFVLFVLFVAGARESTAGVLTLQWDPSPDPSAEGYVVFVGTAPRTYSRTFYIGNQTSFVFDEAAEGQQYYFAVAAYAPGAVVGPLSAEVAGLVGSALALTSPGDQVGIVGQPTALQLVVGDSAGGDVTFEAFGLPPGLTIEGATGLITGTPTSEGSFAVTVSVSDGLSPVADAFVWTIQPPPGDTPPIVRITSPTSETHLTTESFAVLGGTATDDDGVVAVYWRNNRGEQGQATGTSIWMATVPLHPGNNVIAVTAVDARSNSSTEEIQAVRKTP